MNVQEIITIKNRQRLLFENIDDVLITIINDLVRMEQHLAIEEYVEDLSDQELFDKPAEFRKILEFLEEFKSNTNKLMRRVDELSRFHDLDLYAREASYRAEDYVEHAKWIQKHIMDE